MSVAREIHPSATRHLRELLIMEPERAYDRQETLAQLVREALDLFVNPETDVDIREWVKTARREVEAIDVVHQTGDPRD